MALASVQGNNTDRWNAQRGSRPVRIANCSGARSDAGYQMRRQVELGDVDFVTGDYLAEMNLGENAIAMAGGQHPGWQPTAWDGLTSSVDILAKKRIKVVINGGALNPRGLAKKVAELVEEKGLDLVVAAVIGDDLLDEVREGIQRGGIVPHLDGANEGLVPAGNMKDMLRNKDRYVVSANAYLGARGIKAALDAGADIVLCGRVADASLTVGAAWYWWDWKEDDFDRLAGSLIAGHLIECSGYATGGNFSGFDEYPFLELLIDLGFGIAEVDQDGTTVLTKHEGTKGIVNVDIATCQFLYELQGRIYLNSDVSADCADVKIEQVGKDRVRLSGIRGVPPPPTTKLAIYYHGGYESQVLVNATGYATAEKYALMEAQLRAALNADGLLDKFQLLDFQVIGVPEANPRSQHRSTTYLRVFSQADSENTVLQLARCWTELVMQHFSGMHFSLDWRTMLPRPYLGYYPGLYPQGSLKESAVIFSSTRKEPKVIEAGHPACYQGVEARESYETSNLVELTSFGPTKQARLGDVLLARSGDKGANINFGAFVRHPEHWGWLQNFLTRAKLQELMGDDWRSDFDIERVEFRNLLAVHFVIYGPLGRGVSSCALLDNLGKGFADYIRDKVVDIPESILADMESVKAERLSLL